MGTSPLPVPPEALLARVREAYRETPTLRLTAAQVRQRFGLQPFPCVAMLEALLNEKFLCRTSEGLFARSAIPNESTTDGTGGRGSTVPQGG